LSKKREGKKRKGGGKRKKRARFVTQIKKSREGGALKSGQREKGYVVGGERRTAMPRTRKKTTGVKKKTEDGPAT